MQGSLETLAGKAPTKISPPKPPASLEFKAWKGLSKTPGQDPAELLPYAVAASAASPRWAGLPLPLISAPELQAAVSGKSVKMKEMAKTLWSTVSSP